MKWDRLSSTGQSGLFCRSKHGFLPELELRFLQCTCCWRNRIPVAGFETLNTHFLTPSGPCKDDPDKHLDTCYTAEQRDTILQLLNNASPSELACVKLLKGKKSLNIVDYRMKNGPFKTLESVVNVPSLKHKTAHVVFDSILNPIRKEKKARIKLAKFIKPEIDRSWLEVRQCFGIYRFNFQQYLIFKNVPTYVYTHTYMCVCVHIYI